MARFYSSRARYARDAQQASRYPCCRHSACGRTDPQPPQFPIVNHANQVWLLQQAERQREAERATRFSKAQRQADLRELGSRHGGGVTTH